MIKLSKDKRYLKYGERVANDDFSSAREFLKEIADELSMYLSLMYRMIGDTFFLQGRDIEALKFYRQSMKISPDCLLSKLEYAKFLAYKLNDFEEAKKVSKKIIEICIENPFDESETDSSSDYYKSEAEKIIKSC